MADRDARRPLVGVIMGSESDWPTMRKAVEACAELGVACDVGVISAHRTPLDTARYARTAERKGLRVIIAGAGGAAHLAGVIASHVVIPVIGVPIESRSLKGLDSLLSTVQMPSGVPVATVAIDGARNAGLLAVSILATADPALRGALARAKARLAGASREARRRVASDAKALGPARTLPARPRTRS